MAADPWAAFPDAPSAGAGDPWAAFPDASTELPGLGETAVRGFKRGAGLLQETVGAGRLWLENQIGPTATRAIEQVVTAPLPGGPGRLLSGITRPRSTPREQIAAGEARVAANPDAYRADISTPEGRAFALEHPAGYLTSQVSEVAVSTLPSYALAFLTANPWIAGALAGAQEALPDYVKMLDSGMSHKEATARMVAEGVPIGVLNVIPMAAWLGRFPGGQRMLGRMVAGGISEPLTEWAEEPVSAAAQAKDLESLWPDVKRAAIQGINVMPGTAITGLLGGIPSSRSAAAPAVNEQQREQFRQRLETGADPFAGFPDAPAIPTEAYPAPQPVPRLAAPPDFVAGAEGIVRRPGEAVPAPLSLPSPQPSGQFEVSAEGAVRPYTQAEAEALIAERRARADLGLGEADRIARRAATQAIPETVSRETIQVAPAVELAAPSAPTPPPEIPAETQSAFDRLKTDADLRASFAQLAKETGWEEVGGKSLADQRFGTVGSLENIDVGGTTTWIARYPWFKEKPDWATEASIRRVIMKTLAGKPLSTRGANNETVLATWLAEVAAERIKTAPYVPSTEILSAHGLEDNPTDANATALVARAAELDEAAVERLAIQHGDDTAGFLAGIRQFLDAEAPAALERSPGRVETEAPRPAALTPEQLAAKYASDNITGDEGTSDRAAVRNWADTFIRQTAKRLDSGYWLRLDQIAWRDRTGKLQSRPVQRALEWLRKEGAAQVAWDQQGNAFHAKAGVALADGLTQDEFTLSESSKVAAQKAPPAINRDLFAGTDREAESLARRNALAAEQARRAEVQPVPVETGNPADLFSQARQQTDLTQPVAPAPPKPAPKPPPVAPKPAPTSTTSTEDVGQELWYNRRNALGKGLSWDDVRNLNSTLKVREVQKSKIWPRPDYEQLVKDGLHPVTAHLIKQVYDSIAVKPATSTVATDAELQEYIETVQHVRDAVFSWARNVNQQASWADRLISVAKKTEFGNRIELMSLVGQDQKFPMFEAVFPGGFRGENAAANSRRARLLGGRPIARALQPGYEGAVKATQAVKKGWPAPQEAWQRQFVIKQDSNGTWRVQRAATRRIVADGLASQEAAEQRAKELAERQRKHITPEEEVDIRGATRVGVDRRGPNENISTDKLRETFGFRGINFGNWMKGDANAGERQAHVNHAYDALLDLADLLELPPPALSLNGMLGLAIGAQGRGGQMAATAHFVPGVNEINLTRKAGAGALAHEWAHAIDHYFAVQAGERFARGDEPFLTEVTGVAKSETLRPEIATAFKDIVEAMTKRPLTAEEIASQSQSHESAARRTLGNWIDHFRKRLQQGAKPGEAERALKDFDALAERMMRGDKGEGYVKIGRDKFNGITQTANEVRTLFKDATGRVPVIEEMRSLDNALSRLAYVIENKTQPKEHVPQTATSEYYSEAYKLDREKGGERYWTKRTELFARAFQSYVLDRLAERSARNDYLTRPQMTEEAVKAAREMGIAEAGDRYPRRQERARINSAFDVLTHSFLTKPGEHGGTVLYANPFGAAFRTARELFRGGTFRKSEQAPQTGTTRPAGPPPGPIPGHVEAGGGTYTTAPFRGVSPETQRVILDVMQAEDTNIAHERGNEGEPITWARTGSEAQKLLNSKFGKTFNALVNRLPRSAANAATLEAFARIVNTAGEEVQRAVDQYNRTGAAQDLAAMVSAREQLGMALAPFMGYRTEAGRALNILRKVQADFADAQAIFEALGDGNESAMRDFARRVKNAGSVADVLEITRASYQPTLYDQFREYWVNSILSGPWTHVVNMASNTAYQLLDAATEVATSTVSKHVSTRAALARFSGMMAGVQLGIANARKAFLTEEPQFTQHAQIERAKYQAIPGKAGRIVRIPGRALMAEDEFAKAVNYMGELHRLAMDESIRRDPQHPTAAFGEILRSYANNREVQAQAKAHADRLTFQRELGALGKHVMQLREHVPFGWVVAPFIRTPTNILKEATRYTPAALAMPTVREALKAGGREAALAKGRMVIGSAAMAGILSLTLQGMLTGSGPDDPRERELWLRSGKKPYSVKVGDTWYRYNRFEPIGMLVGVAADMAEIGRTVQKGQWDKVGTMLLASILLNLADKTYLRGITDLTQAALDPKRYGPQWASAFVGSVIPNLAAQGARATDPFVRDARGLVDSLKARTPGLRQSLPAKLDVAGQPIPSNVFEPTAATQERNDPLSETMLRLGVFEGSPQRRVSVQGRTVELTSEQYADYKAAVQQARWVRLTPLVTSARFQALVDRDPARAAMALENAYQSIGSAAKRRWLRSHPEIVQQLRGAPVHPRTPSRYAEGPIA